MYTLSNMLQIVLQEIQIIHAVVPGEEELGSSHSQILCLIAHFNHGDFISLDAMSKLRQVPLALHLFLCHCVLPVSNSLCIHVMACDLFMYILMLVS